MLLCSYVRDCLLMLLYTLNITLLDVKSLGHIFPSQMLWLFSIDFQHVVFLTSLVPTELFLYLGDNLFLIPEFL